MEFPLMNAFFRSLRSLLGARLLVVSRLPALEIASAHRRRCRPRELLWRVAASSGDRRQKRQSPHICRGVSLDEPVIYTPIWPRRGSAAFRVSARSFPEWQPASGVRCLCLHRHSAATLEGQQGRRSVEHLVGRLREAAFRCLGTTVANAAMFQCHQGGRLSGSAARVFGAAPLCILDRCNEGMLSAHLHNYLRQF